MSTWQPPEPFNVGARFRFDPSGKRDENAPEGTIGSLTRTSDGTYLYKLTITRYVNSHPVRSTAYRVPASSLFLVAP